MRKIFFSAVGLKNTPKNNCRRGTCKWMGTVLCPEIKQRGSLKARSPIKAGIEKLSSNKLKIISTLPFGIIVSRIHFPSCRSTCQNLCTTSLRCGELTVVIANCIASCTGIPSIRENRIAGFDGQLFLTEKGEGATRRQALL